MNWVSWATPRTDAKTGSEEWFSQGLTAHEGRAGVWAQTRQDQPSHHTPPPCCSSPTFLCNWKWSTLRMVTIRHVVTTHYRNPSLSRKWATQAMPIALLSRHACWKSSPPTLCKRETKSGEIRWGLGFGSWSYREQGPLETHDKAQDLRWKRNISTFFPVILEHAIPGHKMPSTRVCWEEEMPPSSELLQAQPSAHPRPRPQPPATSLQPTLPLAPRFTPGPVSAVRLNTQMTLHVYIRVTHNTCTPSGHTHKPNALMHTDMQTQHTYPAGTHTTNALTQNTYRHNIHVFIVYKKHRHKTHMDTIHTYTRDTKQTQTCTQYIYRKHMWIQHT